ncbi:MAG: hypothetical protein WC350_03035 [Candidatus Micrarchaeia archaeon]|jgi:hypothetical protein
MAIEVCVRCGAKTVKTEKCGYCNRMLCRNCLKSCRKPSRTEKLCICKDCWSKMGKRSEYKRVEKKVEDEYAPRDFGGMRGRGRR